VLHVSFTFAPDPVGGTEIYVEALAHGLRSHGIESLIVAPSRQNRDEVYEHNGLRVRRFRSAPESKQMLRELYGDGDAEAAVGFERILDEEGPDAVHIHAFTRSVSILLIRAVKRRGLPVFFTYHTPTISCQRGTLMLWGEEACDGALRVRRCTSCFLESRGLPRSAANLLSRIPLPIASAVQRAGLSGGIWTAVRMPELVRARHAAFQALMREADGIVAPKQWVHDLLVRNGVPSCKITISQQGLTCSEDTRQSRPDVASTPLRVAFLGRADKMKGVDTLIKAVRATPELSIKVDLYGVTQGAGEDKYWTVLKSLAADDARIKFLVPVPHQQVVSLLRGYHLLAVPSRCLETGPLVVLESLAAGTPVIGSNLGGIAEWIRHEKNGLLVDVHDVQSWAAALCRCAEDRRLLESLRQGTKLPRSMKDVAQDMAQMYRRVSKRPNIPSQRRSSSESLTSSYELN
jgi:glycosyltransferase involved in cell wall biosynthesis